MLLCPFCTVHVKVLAIDVMTWHASINSGVGGWQAVVEVTMRIGFLKVTFTTLRHKSDGLIWPASQSELALSARETGLKPLNESLLTNYDKALQGFIKHYSISDSGGTQRLILISLPILLLLISLSAS